MATMKDVARLAEVSHGTVSNIINGARGVSLDKVQRVEKAMKELGYEPNAVARNLKMNKTMQFDVILPNIISSSLSQVYTNLSMFAVENGYVANLRQTNEDAELETMLLNEAQMHNKDGVVLMTCQPQNKALFDRLRQNGLNIVFIEREPDNEVRDFVGLNVQQTAKSVVSQLLGMGCKEIGIIVGPLEYSCDEQLFDGYVEAYREAGRQVEQEYCAMSSYDRESAFKEAIRLLTLKRPPNVLFTSCKQFLDAALKAIEMLDLPKEKQPMIVSPAPDSWAVTSIDGVVQLLFPYSKLAEEAFSLLLGKMKNGKQEQAATLMIDTQPVNMEQLLRQERPKKNGPPAKKVLRLLLTEDKAKYAVETLVGRFEHESGCRVEIESRDYPGMYRAVKEQWYKDNFDVFDMDIPWIGEAAQKGVIEKLDPYIEADPDFVNDVPPESYGEYCVRDGAVYGMPFTFCTQLLFFRKDYFGDITIQRMFYEQHKRELKPPKTWKEFNEVARFFTRQHNPHSPTEYGTTLGSRISSGGTCEYLPRLWAFGGEVYGENGFTLNSEQAVKALHNYKESFAYAKPGSEDDWWPEQAREFRDGKAAMMMTFADNISAVTEREKSKIIGKIGYELIPGKVNVDGGWTLCLNAHGKNKREAYQFMKWASSREIAIISTILGSFVPCRASIENLEVANIYPWMRKTMEAKKYGRLRDLPRKEDGSYLSEAKFEDILGEMVYHAVTGRITPENALDIANEKLNQLLFASEE